MKRFVSIILCLLLAITPSVSAMAALSLPANLQKIEAEAFAGDASVSGTLSLPSAVTQIGDRAFADTNLYALQMPENIQHIGSGILSGTGAMYVEIPSTTASLADDALTDVTYLVAPEGSVSSSAAAQNVTWLNADSVFTHDGFLYQYTNDAKDAVMLVFPSAPGRGGEFTVPEFVNGAAVVEVSAHAFTGLGSLTKVNVPDRVGMPSEPFGWPENLEIEIIRTEIDPILPDDDREKTQFFFVETSLTLHPGDFYWLSAEEYPDGEWSGHSSNDGVATIDGDCYVEAHGCGSAALTVWVEREDTIYYATIIVNVVDPDITITPAFTQTTLPVGEIRAANWDISSSSDSPNFEYVFESSNEDIAIHSEHGLITGVAPGSATVTLRILKDGVELASASIDVTVVESTLSLNEAMIWAYDIFEYQLEILTELPADAAVAWSSTSDAIIVDQNGLVKTNSGEEGYGDGTVICTVTYADGSTAIATCYVTHASFSITFDEPTEPFVMQVGENMRNPVLVYFMTFPQDRDKMEVTLTSSNERIVSIDADRNLIAHKPGMVTMTLTANFLGQTASTTYEILVEHPYMFIEAECGDMELWVQNGETEIGCWYECSAPIDRLTVTSSNPDVAKAYLSGDRLHIIPVCEGHTVITVTMGVGDDQVSTSVNVTVYGHTISLSESALTLAVGESIQLTPVLQEGQEMDYNHLSFWSSDESIAVVDNEGRVVALNAGTAMIYMDTRVNGEYAQATCIVTVTDAGAQLTLSHTVLHMARGEQVQLSACLNGEEVTGGTWSVSDSGLYVTSDGLLTLRHDWPETFAAYVTFSIELDGETRTASCMVTGRVADVTLDTPTLFIMSEGEAEWVWANFSSTVEGENYTIRVTSSNENVASFPYDSQELVANGAGECTVTIELLDSAGKTVATRYCQVMVDAGIPELERLEFGRDVYYITTQEDNRTSTYLDPLVEPISIWELADVTITSSDEGIAYVDGYEAVAASTGTATMTLTHECYPEVSDEATIYVVNPEFTASAENVAVGETVTFTISGLPDQDIQQINWYTDDHHLSYVDGGWDTLTMRARNAGETNVHVYVELPDLSFDYDFPLSITGEAKQLNFSDLIIEAGKSEHLWADFGHWDDVWSSSNASIAMVNEEGIVTAIADGECDITLTCQTEEGEYTASCHVVVADGEWTLVGIDLPPVLVAGNEYELIAGISSTYYAWPDEIIWDLGENSLLEWVDGDTYRAVAPGQMTIIVTAIEGEHVETASLTVRVVEPAVRLANTYLDLRPNIPYQLEFITAPGKEIESVVWSTSQDWALFVDGNNAVTLLADEGRYGVTAQVTLTDGTTHSLSAVIRAIPNYEVYVNVWYNDHDEMLVTETRDLHLQIDTNAWEEEVSITWTSFDENIAVIEDVYGFAGCTAVVRGLNDGDVTFSCNVQVGDFFNETFYLNVHVFGAEVWINLDRDDMLLFMRDGSQECMCWYGSNLPIDVLNVISDNPDVVRVYMMHDRVYLIPVNEGSTVITANISARGYHHFDTMVVNVIGSSIALNVSEATLNVGDVMQLSPIVSEDQKLNYNERHYETSNASIAYVNGDGLVTALTPGTARIRLQTRVNDEDAVAYCIVTVVDDGHPLTLNADHLSLSGNEQYQLKALWNGEEIDDVVWSVSENGLTVNNSGVVTMYHNWTESAVGYVTATVERDGATYTATCMVNGKAPEIVLNIESAVIMNTGDFYWLNPHFTTSADYGALHIQCISSNEDIVTVEEDGQTLYANGAGTCTVKVQLVTEANEVIAEKTIPVYVESELPELESIVFAFDEYYLELNNQSTAHLDPRTEPRFYQEQGELIITSSDENVVYIDGYEARAVGTGTATLSMYSTLAPDKVATATVYVYDWQVSVSTNNANVNELITVTLSGLEDAPLTNLYWNTDEGMLRFIENNEPLRYTFRTMHPGEVWIEFVADLSHATFSSGHQVYITGEFWPLNMTDAYYEPGHEFDLRPEFGSWDHAWSSTDENVATVDENGHVRTVNEGECEIILNCNTDNGPYTASCLVHVANGEWTLVEYHLDDVLYVGTTYGTDYHIANTYNAWPETVIPSVSGDAVEQVDGENFLAVKPGIATFTLTATEGDQVETITKTVIVVEPAVRLEQSNFDLRPGFSAELSVIPASGKEIASIEWHYNAEALTISPDGTATLFAEEGQYNATATVLLTDGTTHTLSAWINAIPDRDIWHHLSMADYYEMNLFASDWIGLDFITNAWDEEISIEWQSSNEDILTVTQDPNSHLGSIANLYACGTGEVSITCTFRIGDFIVDSRTCHLVIWQPTFEIFFQQDEFYLSLQDGTRDVWLNINTDIMRDTITVVSSNTDVVRAYVSNDRVRLIPVNEGKATLTVTMAHNSLISTDELRVIVSGKRLELSQSAVELSVGESLVLTPVLTDGQTMNQFARSYWSSNENVAIVDGDGVVCAVSAGTAIITFDTEIDCNPNDGETSYTYARAQCVVTVTDPESPLTLNEQVVALPWNESFQLKALWNGEEIDDVVWSSNSTGVTVTSTGLAYMRAEFSESDHAYITATVERDGETFTATCLITGKMAAERIEMQEALSLSVGDGYFLSASFTSTVEGESYTLVMTSSDESIVHFPEGGMHLEALAAGTATVTAEMKNSRGETVATRTCMVYVDTDLPELEFIGFGRDVFFVTTLGTDGCETYTDPCTIPQSVTNFCDVVITAEDPTIVEVDGHSIRGLQPGMTTITLSHPMYPGQTDTATVYVMDLTLTAETTELNVGDLLTLNVPLDSVPDEYIRNAFWSMDEYVFNYAYGGWDTWTIRARNEGVSWVNFHLDLPDVSFFRSVEITVTGEALQLNHSDYIVEPGNDVSLWPEFECSDQVWNSSNESIATVDEYGNFHTHAIGECDITMTAVVNGESVMASCHVIVADGEWHLTDIEIGSILYLGNAYWPNAAFSSYYGAHPHEVQWATSDSSILAYNEEDGHLHVLKAGTVDIIVTATEGDQVETFIKTVYVAEPKVRLSDVYPHLRPGVSTSIELIVGSGSAVENVVWSSENEEALSITADGVITMNAAEGDWRFTAEVTLDDGSVHMLNGWCHSLQDWEISFETWIEGGFAETTLGSNIPASLHLWTNAADYETYVFWGSYDENIVKIGEQNGQINTEVELIPCGVGETIVWCRVEIGENARFHGHTMEMIVVVHPSAESI